MNISLLNSSGVVLPHLTQYDQNITLVCEDIDALDISSAPEFHFFNSKSSEMLRVQSSISDDKLNVHIPNILLIQPQTIIADIYTIDANEVGKCIYSMKIPITGRPVPSDFIYADDSGLIINPVPATRTIAGLPLSEDITKSQLQQEVNPTDYYESVDFSNGYLTLTKKDGTEDSVHISSDSKSGDVLVPQSKYEVSAFASTSSDCKKKYRGLKIPANGTVNNNSYVGVIINDARYVHNNQVTLKYRLECTPTSIDLSYYLNFSGADSYEKVADGVYDITKTLTINNFSTKTSRRTYVTTRQGRSYTEDIIVKVTDVFVVTTTNEQYEEAKSIYDKTTSGVETINLTLDTQMDSLGTVYTDLVDLCASINDGSESKIYNLTVKDGTYELYDLLDISNIQDQTVGRRGCELPDYFNIKGLGGATIKCTLPSTETAAHVQAISTLNMTGNNVIENVTIEAENCRYCVHDDTGTQKNSNVKFVNVKMIHHGNSIGTWTSVECYGAGYRSGRNALFKNCVFVSDDCTPFYVHNTNLMTETFSLEIDNCVFVTSYSTSISIDGVYTQTGNNTVTINNCILTSDLELKGNYNVSTIFIGGGNGFDIDNVIDNTVYLSGGGSSGEADYTNLVYSIIGRLENDNEEEVE